MWKKLFFYVKISHNPYTIIGTPLCVLPFTPLGLYILYLMLSYFVHVCVYRYVITNNFLTLLGRSRCSILDFGNR